MLMGRIQAYSFLTHHLFLEYDIYGTVHSEIWLTLCVLKPIYCALGTLISVVLDCHLESIWTLFIILVLNKKYSSETLTKYLHLRDVYPGHHSDYMGLRAYCVGMSSDLWRQW